MPKRPNVYLHWACKILQAHVEYDYSYFWILLQKLLLDETLSEVISYIGGDFDNGISAVESA
jgi:hypothetical protein